jgi:hypothetical protein
MDDNDDNTTGNPSTFLNLNRGAAGGDGGVSDLEQDVLDEYARLAGNMKTVCWFRFCPVGESGDVVLGTQTRAADVRHSGSVAAC